MPQNRTDKFVKNVIGSALLQIVTIVTGFISPRLMLSAFGSEINGITSSITQFISYLALVEAGLSNATIFALYKPLADGNNKERDAVVSAARISYYRIGIAFVALSLVLALIYPMIGHTEIMENWELSLLVLVLCCNSTINFFVLAKYRTLLTADQCGYYISLASSVQLIVHLLLLIVTIHLGFGVIAVRACAVSSMFLTSLILAIIVRIKYGDVDFHAKPNMKALDRRWDAMHLQILGVVATGSPVVIMTALLDYKQISVYAIYNMIAGTVATCISVFTNGLGAGFGNIYATGDKELLKRTTEEFRVAFYILITIVYSVMMSMMIPFVRIYTDGITDANYILPLFGVLITLKGLLDNFKAPHGMLIYSLGKFSVIKRQTLIQSIIIIVSTLVLTKMLGVEGCMWALCIANVYMLVELLILSPRELVEMSIAKNVRQIVQVLVIVFGVYYVVNNIDYQPTGYMSWLIEACIVGIITVLVTFIVFWCTDRRETKCVVDRISTYLKKVKR